MTEPQRKHREFITPAAVLRIFTHQELIDELRRRDVIQGRFYQYLARDWSDGPCHKERRT